ncbi:hypothetical protein Tco_0271984 [Tanacetum coccineum]
MDESQSYLTATEHKECYDGLIKSYDLDKSLFSTYDKVYSLKRSQKDKDEDHSAGSDRGLKKRKTSKDVEPTKAVMSADSAVTYTSVHSEARSWSIPSEDPYEEAAQQLFEQAPRHPEYDLVPAEDEAPIPLLPPSFLAPRIRPLSPRALEVEMRDVASAYYHSVHPSGTPPVLPIPLPAPSSSRRADVPEADAPPRKRLLLTTPRPGCEIGESSASLCCETARTHYRDQTPRY